MATRDVVVIGGSAGGHAALQQLLPQLPADLPAAVLVVMHLAPGGRSSLAEMLAKSSAMPVLSAADGMILRRGRVYVAVPDRHLAVGDGDVIRLSVGPRENRVRPAADALFRSAARWCGPRVMGVVLSGSLDDGAAGLASIQQRGGIAMVQSPREARFPGMPSAALAAVPSATAAPAAELAEMIVRHAGDPVNGAEALDEALIWGSDMVSIGRSAIPTPGEPVALGCPECSGGLREVRTGRALHYVCHVGHSFSPQSFIAASDDGIEEALWTAVSAIQEKATMLRQLATRSDEAGGPDSGKEHRAEAERIGRSAELIRRELDRVRSGAAGD